MTYEGAAPGAKSDVYSLLIKFVSYNGARNHSDATVAFISALRHLEMQNYELGRKEGNCSVEYCTSRRHTRHGLLGLSGITKITELSHVVGSAFVLNVGHLPLPPHLDTCYSSWNFAAITLTLP